MEVDIDQFFEEYRPMIQKQMGFQTDEQWQVRLSKCCLWRQAMSRCDPGLRVLLLTTQQDSTSRAATGHICCFSWF